MKEIFTINDIITIVMNKVQDLESYGLYGLEDESELNFPKGINDKLESLNGNDYEDFMSKVSDIAEEILSIKSGELNELNFCHQEIVFLAEDTLKMYIKQ